MAVVGKALLVAVTLVFLGSMGGGMLLAAPVLVPLHWWVARDAGPRGTAFWAFLAGLSLYEVGWMAAWAAGVRSAWALMFGLAAFVATVAVFIGRGGRRYPTRASSFAP